MAIVELHLPIESPNNQQSSVVQLLAHHCELSNADIKQAVSKGALWLERTGRVKRLRRMKPVLRAQDTLHFYYNSDVLAQTVTPAVLIEDFKEYSLWYKPYGVLSQGSKWSDHCTIHRFVEQYFDHQRSCFIVHRLDRAASGLIIIAHSKNATRAFGKLFEQHDLLKRYSIAVFGNARALDSLIVTQEIDNKPAKSTLSFVEYDAQLDSSLVCVDIDTGRKHQIRKHAAFAGFPVIGDRLHGIEAQTSEHQAISPLHRQLQYQNNLQLCAVELAFICPITGIPRHIKLPAAHSISLAKISS
ncbi:pseudouridine synthase [Echinimonas agarilytica]|uniref:Pseudouridine synthase n=1 Tax=Echinimonas agarilytica TaxID=1215918 RepID=A0AA41W9Z6_9GAMM|nr:pseudouridine synthase [Echinimonas agarilytica]MCM2681028.1 pseudouridine synthase [Echinimonas agarilytica]